MAVKQRMVLGLKIAIAGALMFVVPSAYVIARGWPWWAAAAIGALAFPVLPVGWQIVGERKRRRVAAAADPKSPPKSHMTRAERFGLRSFVVALAVIGPMIAIGRLDVARAVVHHGAWFVPHAQELPAAALVARVPSDADLVIVVSLDGNTPGLPITGQGVFALGHGQAMVASDFAVPPALDKLNAMRDSIPFLGLPAVAKVEQDGATFVGASDGWKTHVAPGDGPNPALRAELALNPATANVAFAIVESTSGVASNKTTHAHGSATITADAIVFEAHIDAVDVASATTTLKIARDEVDTSLAKSAKSACRAAATALTAATHVELTGTVITVHGELARSDLAGLMTCVN